MALLSLALADRINSMREQQAQTLLETGQKLEVLNQQLAHSNRLKDEFLATLTHELRTPMNGVIGSLELMQTLELDPELEQYQQTAAGSARDMMRMVNGILTLTELQAGKLTAQLQPFSLRSLLSTLQTQFGASAANKSLSFQVDLGANMPDRLLGDRCKLSHCLECLLENAVKFTPSGGVTLRVISRPARAGRVSLIFEVVDSGIGFVNLDEATLYQRFFQLDGTMTREYGGLGIGLAICRQLVELLGGQLTHESSPGQGSCFRLHVELDSQEPLARAPEIAQRRRPQDCTVLLVDDNDVNQLVLRGMLLKLGYRVRTVAGPTDALQALGREAISGVLVDGDISTAQLGAFRLQVQALPGYAHLPILLACAPGSEDVPRAPPSITWANR